MHLLERERFVSELLRLAAGAREGRGAAAMVCGEAGIGKTSLVMSVADQAQNEMRVLRSGCEALFTPRPLGPIYDIAAELHADLDQARERMFPAVLNALSSDPTLLVVEDVHWADRATLDLLKYVIRRVMRLPLLVVLTYRDDEISPAHPLVSLLGETTASRRLALPPLSLEAVGALASERGRDARTVYELTSGNPFYVTELLAGDQQRVPPTVRDTVLARAAKLSPAARRVLDVASCVPGKAERWLIEEDAAALEEATTSGIASLRDGSIVFRHELGRRALEDALPGVRRETLHASILATLQTREGVPLARLAHHAAGARDVSAILHFAPLAAEEAIRADAHREAAAHYRSVLPFASSLSGEQRADLLERLAYECYLTEQEAEALEHRGSALAIWRSLGNPLKEGDNLRWLSRLNWFLGRNADSHRFAEEAIRVLEPLPAGPELAMAYSNRAQLHMLAGDVQGAVLWGGRAIQLATSLGDHVILAHALNNVGTAELAAGIGDGHRKLEESLRIALAGGFQEHAARAYTNLITQAVIQVDYSAADRHLAEGVQYCVDRDLDAWRIYITAWRARLHLERGQWTAATDDAHTVLMHPSVAAISRIPALAALARVRTRRGDPGAAALLDEARELAQSTGEFQRLAPVACARAEAAWLRGDLEATVEEARPTFELGRDANDRWARGELSFWMWRGGAIDAAPAGTPEPFALQMAGDFRGAAEAWQRVERPYEAARALADSQTVDDLREALAILESLGDGTLAASVRARLRSRTARASTKRNPHGLTDREIEILELVSDGLRNSDIAARLFVSPKTVDHHVSAVLSKLGARTRGEAARIFREK